MDEYRYQRLLSEDATFEHPSNFHFVDVWRYEGSTEDLFLDGEVSDGGVSNWLKQIKDFELPSSGSGPATEGLRILMVPNTPERWTQLPLPIYRKTFEHIMEAFKLPHSFLDVVRRGTTALVKVPLGGNAGLLDSEGFILQNSFTRSANFSLALAFMPKENTTLAFLIGLQEQEILDLRSRLRFSQDYTGLPMLFPALLLEIRVDSVTKKVAESHQQICDVEERTGIQTKWDATYPQNSPATQRAGFSTSGHINFVHISQELTCISSKLAYCAYTCTVHLPMLDDLDDINRACVEMAPADRRAKLQAAEACLRSNNALLRGSLQGTLCRITYLSQRVQSQVQVVYSLIAQKDNALNMQIAKASLQLAEASKRDSAAMRAIAEDSKMVALATSRDSAAMRTIAAVTILFLPATFTATLFSTSFFNFQATGSQNVVSWWLWLYWVVTITLTMVIHASWYAMSHKKEKEIDKAFGSRGIRHNMMSEVESSSTSPASR